jgi:vancomycin resistance protein YoaR
MAVSEETLHEQRGIGIVRPGRRFAVFAAATAIGTAGVAAAAISFHEGLAGRILPGVSVAGVDVGGLTTDEARATLAARYADLASGSVTLRSSIGSTTLRFSDVGRGPDIDGMLQEAAAVGRGGTWLDETIGAIRIRMEPRAVDLQLTYDHDRAAALVDGFVGRSRVDASNASATSNATGFVTIPSVDGQRIDGAAALAAVDAAMADTRTIGEGTLQIPVITVPPALTTAEVDAARAQADRMVGPLVVTAGAKKWTIAPARIRSWITFGWANGSYGPLINRSLVPAAFKNIAKKVARPVHDAAFLRDKRGRIVGAMADSAGRALDLKATTGLVVGALNARAAGRPTGPMKLALAAVLPKRTTKDVTATAPLMVKLGSWTTRYQSSPHNGFSANISVPTRKLNGTIVRPGEVFDFWQSLGEVSFRTGYRLGGAIVGGHSVEGKALAGGICAASTTLFNAALRGGFEILARQPHWYYITRYPLGLDATVSGSQTMRFRNDTPNAILIRGFASPGYVHYEIWSVPNGRTVSLSRPSVSNVVKGYDTTVQTASLPAGTSERTEWPVDGKDVVVTRTVRDAAGHVIHRDTFVSHYHRMVGINRIGIG